MRAGSVVEIESFAPQFDDVRHLRVDLQQVAVGRAANESFNIIGMRDGIYPIAGAVAHRHHQRVANLREVDDVDSLSRALKQFILSPTN